MQRFCALIVWLMVGFAVIAGPGIGPAFSEKQNKDQDKTNKKKSEAGENKEIPKSSPLEVRQYCMAKKGQYTSNETGYGCTVGCGTGGCNIVVGCSAKTHRCMQQIRPGKFDDVRADDDAQSILGSGPSLSVNGPSRTGTPKPVAPTPAAPPPPSPNPG